MKIAPSVNCPDFACVSHKFLEAQQYFPEDTWLHIDVADARFTYGKSWGNPEELRNLLEKHPELHFNIEVHLMVEEPEEAVKLWMDLPIQRIIVHLEAIKDQRYRKKKMSVDHVIESIIKRCVSRRIEVMLATNPETDLENEKGYLEYFTAHQVLAVRPGPAGQSFLIGSLDKIRFLRNQFPNATIEVDGGINLDTAKLCKEAGADILVAGSYTFNSEDPKRAFEELTEI